MGLAPEDVERIRLSALLHDVGKIGVDDRIIRKPTALTEEEFEAMKTHPIKGAAIMSAIPQLADVIPGMKYHHEKWTGGGYPEGLSGEQIPLQARIVSVADTFDAMTTTRPYQKAMEIDFVVDRIRQFAGVRYDPRVVQAFLRAYEKGRPDADPRRRELGRRRDRASGGALMAGTRRASSARRFSHRSWGWRRPFWPPAAGALPPRRRRRRLPPKSS